MKWITRIVIKLLRWSKLPIQDRIALTSALLDKFNAPREIIKTMPDGRMLIDGRAITIETARVLRESALATLNSQARKFVQEQVAFKAITLGVHNGDAVEKLFFCRAALWWGQEEEELLKTLAGNPGEDDGL